MKIVTWNVNSIRVREARVLRWLETHSPDVLCLQELKGTEDIFPFDSLAEIGYNAEILGQRTYNGVALISRHPIMNVQKNFPDNVDDDHARFISADIQGIHIMNGYFPNGKEVGSDKYEYKLAWLERLRKYLQARDLQTAHLLCGDFNIAPSGMDTARADAREGNALFNPTLRQWFSDMLELGFTDTFRHCYPDAEEYSWWDYRHLSFPKNTGMRIDHILVTKPLEETLQDVWIDREERKGSKEDKPSDHVPVMASFGLGNTSES